MIAEQALYDALKNDAVVSNIVADKIYPNALAPQGTDTPYLSFFTILKELQPCLKTGSNTPTYRINMTINCWSTSYTNVKDLAEAVTNAVMVLHPAELNEQDFYEYDTKLHRVAIDMTYWW